jgi:hypothetical protein
MNDSELLKQRRKEVAMELSERADNLYFKTTILKGKIIPMDEKQRLLFVKYKNYFKCLMLLPLLVWMRSRSTYLKYVSIPICFGLYCIISDSITYEPKYNYSPPVITERLTKYN